MGWFTSLLRVVILGAVLGALAGCASNDAQYASLPSTPMSDAAKSTPQKLLQCAPYARDHSVVKIYGDAWTWWDQAAGKYPESALPQTGSVMVLTGYAGTERGHVAVVRQIVSPREIRVDHANWLDDGAIYLNDPVEDVSDSNDWSEVKVFNIKTGGWGAKVYPVQGFIGGGAAPNDPDTAPPQDLSALIARVGNQKNDN